MHPALRLCLLLVLPLLAACSGTNVTQTSGSTVRGTKVSEVIVKADQTALDEFDKHRLQFRKVDEFIAKELRTKLAIEGRLVPKGPSLVVTIKDFHIRSTMAAVMVGAMAGTDFIEAKAEVVERGKVLKSFDVREPGAGGYGSESRIIMMSEDLAEDLVEQL